MQEPGVLSIDQGSGSTKALVLNSIGEIVARSTLEIKTSFPQPGWVQQNPEKIWESVVKTASDVISQCRDFKIVGIGLSTQRESLVVWSRSTGKSLSPVLTWQDRSSAPLLPRFAGSKDLIRTISGLPLDPMFTALKATQVLAEITSDLADICIGTIDSWLLWNLGAGHVIESGNASRTQLMDVKIGKWSSELLEIFSINSRVLPEIIDSNAVLGIKAGVIPGIAADTPVSGVMGDSHAALFAHAGWLPGRVKATYGTGSSIMTLGKPRNSSTGLCTTIAWSLNGIQSLALEANILSSGSTLVWLANLLGDTVENLMQSASSSHEIVQIIPAFNGLAAPWWDDNAVGLISGVSLGTTRADIASAGMDSIAMQVSDVLDEIRLAGVNINSLRVDGGPTRNAELLQRQSDFGNILVEVPDVQELSAIGAGNLAGLTVGLWTIQDLETRARIQQSFIPQMDHAERSERRNAWKNAVARARMRI